MPEAVKGVIGAALVAVGVFFANPYLISMGASLLLSTALGMVFAPRVSNGFATEAQGRTQIVRSNIQPRNIIYGRAMTSGPLIYAGSTDGDGKKNQYMHLVIALADHECDAVEDIYLGTDPIGPLDAAGNVTMNRFLRTWGTPGFVEQVVQNQTAVTIDTGNAIRKVVSVTASNRSMPVGAWSREELGYDLSYQAINSWTINGSKVKVTGIPTWATRVSLTYEIQNSEPLVRAKIHLGADDQIADQDLVREVAGWTQQHRLRGVCYIYLRLKYNPDVFPNGLPNVKAQVRGKKVLDLRTGTTAWSANWALCIYDFLRDSRGFGCADSDIDLQSVIAAANVSDEFVWVNANTVKKRYLCNGIVTTDKSPRDSLSEMITAGAGAVTISGGAFRVFAGAYDIPSVSLTESDLRGPVRMRARHSRRDLFNRVKGTFVNPDNNWQPSDFPPMANATYATQDGEVIDRDIELPFTTDSVQAQRLAKIILERSRQGIVVEFPAKLTAFQLSAYSTVMVTLKKFGWDKKVFRVMDWRLSENGGVDLVLNEEAAAVYDWNYGHATTVDPAPDTNLPSPFDVSALEQILLDSGDEQLVVGGAGQVVSRILATWPEVTEQSIAELGKIEVQYARVDVGTWISVGTVSASETSAYIAPVVDGVPYVVRARVISVLGVRSDWTYSDVHTVIGKLAPPADITGLSLTVLNGMAHLEWDPAVNVDVRVGGRARIRHTTDTAQPSWGSAIDIGGFISGAANSAQLPLIEGAYLAKWIDSSGNESINAKQVITTAPSLVNFNRVEVIREAPYLFKGDKTNVVYDAALGGIKIAGDAPGSFDVSGFPDAAGGIARAGLYKFYMDFDLGRVEKSRLTAKIDAVAFDGGDYWDQREDFIDQWPMIDGDAINDASVDLYIRTTKDDPDGNPTWSGWQRFVIGDYEARAFQWALFLYSASLEHNVAVTDVSVTVDMPDRRESAANVVSNTGVTRVTFSKPFRSVPALGVTAQNMAQGDFFIISTKAEGYFEILFFNSAGLGISRKFDWSAIAY